MRKLFVVASVLVVCSPSFVSAAIFCPQLTDNLYQGTCDTTVSDDLVDLCQRHVAGTQVTDLQHFLTDYYHPATNIMLGFFGNKTKTLVMRFQGEHDLPQSGQVRALTRAAIAQSCGGTTNTQPPPHPPMPTCTLSVNPSTVSASQSSTLSWTSTNSSAGSILPGIGAVGANGSQSVSVLNTTTFTGTFSNPLNTEVARCSTTLTVSNTTDNTACTTPWGARVGNGSIVVAYQAQTALQCISENRTCRDGVLSGTYQYASCTPTSNTYSQGSYNANSITLSANPTSGQAPLLVGFGIAFPQPVTSLDREAYIVDFGDGQSQKPGPACDDPPITDYCRTHLYTQHTYTSAGTYTVRLKNVLIDCQPTNPNCYIISTVTVNVSGSANGGTYSQGTYYSQGSYNTGEATLTATPSLGAAPLTVLFSGRKYTPPPWSGDPTLDFGDGTIVTFSIFCNTTNNYCEFSGPGAIQHVYTTAGTYTAKFKAGSTILATTNVVVGGTTAGPSITLTSPQTNAVIPKASQNLRVSWVTQNAPAASYVTTYLRFNGGDPQPVATPAPASWGTITTEVRTYGSYTVFSKLSAAPYSNYLATSAEVPFTVTGSTGMVPSISQLASVLAAIESTLRQLLISLTR